MPKSVKTIIVLLVLAASTGATANELEYVSDKELSDEITSRKSDIERTQARIEKLNQNEIKAMREIHLAQKEVNRIEKMVTARTQVLYRLHRNGGSLRYLLGSSSATQFLRRLSELKHLLKDGINARRQAGHRLAQANSRLTTNREDKRSATVMLAQLEQTLAELLKELTRRPTSPSKVALAP